MMVLCVMVLCVIVLCMVVLCIMVLHVVMLCTTPPSHSSTAPSHSTTTQSTIMHSSETVCGMVCRWSAGVNAAADGAVRRRSATTAVAKGEGAGAGATDCQKGRAAAEASDGSEG